MHETYFDDNKAKTVQDSSSGNMDFVPDPQPRGYSYYEDFVRDWKAKKGEWDIPSDDFIVTGIRDMAIENVLKSAYARQTTIFVQKGVRFVYKTPPGKILINKIASTSLNGSVQGAAAISHVSKVVRSHAIANFGMMIYNDGMLLRDYWDGEIDGTEFGQGLFTETLAQGGDMVGWMVGASIAATFLCGPFGAAACAVVGSVVGRGIGQSLARKATKG